MNKAVALHPGLPEFMADHLAEFQPFAYYDKHLDCIRVQIRDCSILEERKGRIFTVLKASHSGSGAIVGVNIKGVRHLFETLGLKRGAVYRIVDVMNAIVRAFPEQGMKQIADEMADVLGEQKLQALEFEFAPA